MAARSPLALLLLVQAALLFFRLGMLPVWGDEQFTLTVIAMPWAEIPAKLAADIHPPLYYVLLKLWATVTPFLDPLIAARAFSGVCALLLTVALDRLWLRERNARSACLWLWVLAPAVVLYGRMARSYTLQALLAVIAVYALVRLLEEPARGRSFAFAGALAAVLWTHYLPGLAIAAAGGLWLLLRSWRHALLSGVIAGALYAPWLAVLADAVSKASAREAYQLSGSGLVEHALRLTYTALSFSAGEAHSLVSLALAAVAGLLLFGSALRGAARETSPLAGVLLVAATVGYAGAAGWVAYAFMPARLLFLYPILVLFAARGSLARPVPYLLGALFIVFNAHYFGGASQLNKGYEIPYRAIAERIERTPPERTLVIADAFNADPSPLAALLGGRYRLIVAHDGSFPAAVAQAVADRRPRTIWYVRTSRDITDGKLHEAVEERLMQTYRAQERSYLPYSELDRYALGALTGQPPPTHHFRVLELNRE